MESIKTRGLIIKSSDYGENNRIIKIFTSDLGIISASVYGAHSKKKGLGASCRVFLWGDIMLKETGGRYRADEIIIKEGFYPLCEDIVKLSVASYFAELVSVFLGEYNPDESVLKLILNTLFAMCYNGITEKRAKTVFELRLAMEAGYMPQTDRCSVCGASENLEYFDAEESGMLCSLCRRNGSIKVSKGTAKAIKYIFTAGEKQIFSFRVNDEIEDELSAVAEKYISQKLDYPLKTLDYYKKMSEL